MSAKKLCSILMFIIFTQFAQAFTLSLTKIDESCTANGSISITVSNTIPGATMVYTIYRLPDLTTPISVQNNTAIGGLVAGDYRVVASESNGSVSTSEQQDITIVDNIINLSYQSTTQNVRCGHDGKITVNILTGRVPFHYEIFQGPMTFASQTSNVFSGLIAGQYSIRVFDGCGEGVVRTLTVETDNVILGFFNHTYELLTCNTIKVNDQVQPLIAQNGAVVYPLRVQYTLNPPSGPAVVLPEQIINSGMSDASFFNEIIPYYYGQPSSYSIRVIDGCNRTYVTSYDVDVHLELRLILSSPGCSTTGFEISPDAFLPPYTVTFLESPAGFSPTAGNQNHPGPFYNGELYQVNGHFGYYLIKITDACGRTAQRSIEVPPNADSPPILYTNEGCEDNEGGVFIYPTVPLLSVTLITAPQQFNHPLPYPVSMYINGGYFYMGSLPAGQYTFRVVDSCGGIYPVFATILGYQEQNNINIIEHCGSFDINLINTSNAVATPAFWLQKYDPVTQLWGHPGTGVTSNSPILGNDTAISLVNNAINYNFSFTGTFRIVKNMSAFGNGDFDFCQRTLKEFVFDGKPKINKVYSFSCNNGTYDVIVDATGTAPLIYRIIEKDGQPFVVENANSYIFLGVQAGHYKFQVEDPCGNILNSEFDVPNPFAFGITEQNLCDGQSGTLVVPGFSILHYSWWKDNNTSTVLSTSSTLNFTTFNTTLNAGVYHVRVWYTGNPNSCLDFVLDYNVIGNNTPHAGLDNSVSFCRGQSLFDLNTLLTGTVDASGTWTEVTNSGTLVNNIWNASDLPAGIYHFNYEVSSCNLVDAADITIEIKDAPNDLTASVDAVVCEGSDINLTSDSSNPDATYSWTGPNAFSSTEQNPVISNPTLANSGIYNVVAAIGSCATEAFPVEVEIAAIPDFIIDAKCEEGRFVATVIPINESFDVTTVSFIWTGPNNYTNTTNPIDITQLATGNYSVMVTDASGCDKTVGVDIDRTICFIPNVITPNNDDANEGLDLTGFNVTKIEIYNRWGRKVYERNNYLNQWHGQNMSGGILPDSTYYYIIKLGEEETKTGWVFLSRG